MIYQLPRFLCECYSDCLMELTPVVIEPGRVRLKCANRRCRQFEIEYSVLLLAAHATPVRIPPHVPPEDNISKAEEARTAGRVGISSLLG